MSIWSRNERTMNGMNRLNRKARKRVAYQQKQLQLRTEEMMRQATGAMRLRRLNHE